jgi:tRNA-dihydrouridine synthase
LVGQIGHYLATGAHRPDPPLAEQLDYLLVLYEDMLAHHGVQIGRRHARKHLAASLEVAAATSAASQELLKAGRARVLTADDPAQVTRAVREAFDAFSNQGGARDAGSEWRAAA